MVFSLPIRKCPELGVLNTASISPFLCEAGLSWLPASTTVITYNATALAYSQRSSNTTATGFSFTLPQKRHAYYLKHHSGSK